MRRAGMYFLLSALICTLLIVPRACRGAGESGEKEKKEAADPKKGRLVARIGEREIYEAEIKEEIARMPDRFKVGWDEDDEGRMAAFVRHYVQNLILLERAKKAGIDRRPEVASEIEDFSRGLIVSTYLQDEAERRVKELAAEEVRQYYQEHIRGFTRPDRARVKMIKVDSEAKTKKILARLEKGEEFGQVAALESGDKQIDRIADSWEHVSGVGTFFGIEKAVFSLKPGEYTKQPLKRIDYYYLFQMEQLMPAQNKPFEEIKDEVEFALRRLKWKQVKQETVDEALKEAGVEFYLKFPGQE